MSKIIETTFLLHYHTVSNDYFEPGPKDLLHFQKMEVTMDQIW